MSRAAALLRAARWQAAALLDDLAHLVRPKADPRR